ncbi:pyridoxamine 5'-phosphate oxidase family protein [Chroococcidiopsis sp. CCMEE 29]|uniref:pyridoxamine 5'-phosphate oxidase family protein n=1 Tax=Chroococcidiopsis sp. CCMEE 29 TaxID=155894 RepID=UPI0020211997|nr:pyridoxamine 5'-phosphate oxidase family protein [Chroococcidiopsis sp. CCMEE 29]
MLDIDEMGAKEIQDLLQKVGYGHLGCAFEGQPYVVPMHYYFENPDIYIFTTEGMKTKYIDANPQVCLQVEEVHNLLHWRSVIVTGRAERLTEQQDIDQAMQFIKERNPTLSPALNRTWIDSWGRANVIAIYRMHPSEMNGHKTDGVSSQ